MIIRVLTDSNFLDIEVSEPIDENVLIKSIDESSTILLIDKDGHKIFINTCNVVAIELLDKLPPISK